MIGLGITVLILILLWNLPLGVDAEYSEEGPVVKAVLGKISVLIFPREKKDKTKEPKKEKKPKDKSPKPMEKKGGKITFFKELLGIGLRMLGAVRRKLRMEQLTLHLTVGGGGDDPASAAAEDRRSSAWCTGRPKRPGSWLAKRRQRAVSSCSRPSR